MIPEKRRFKQAHKRYRLVKVFNDDSYEEINRNFGAQEALERAWKETFPVEQSSHKDKRLVRIQVFERLNYDTRVLRSIIGNNWNKCELYGHNTPKEAQPKHNNEVPILPEPSHTPA